jgi:hypothetical protein
MSYNRPYQDSSPELISSPPQTNGIANGLRMSEEQAPPQIPRTSSMKLLSPESTALLDAEYVNRDGSSTASGNPDVHVQYATESSSLSKDLLFIPALPMESEFVFNDSTAKIFDKPHDIEGVARPLRPYKALKRAHLVMEFFLCLTPIAFLILAILARCLDGQGVSKYGENIKEWTILSPTIFPLVFTAVAGQSLRNIACYRLERGCVLQVSESRV